MLGIVVRFHRIIPQDGGSLTSTPASNAGEDGNLFAIAQGGSLVEEIFQQLALGAAYTPASLGGDGKIYSQNDGHLFVVGK
jgi:flagellar basal body P-ring protein FlgI